MPQSPYQVYSAGQQISQGPGNRYIPPTYNYRTGTAGSPRNYNEMDWNNVQSYNLPQQQNNPYQQLYMQGLRDTTSRFGQMPQMPQFGSGPRTTIGGFPAQQRSGMGGNDRYYRIVTDDGYDVARQQPWSGQENYGGGMAGRPSMPNFQGGGQGGMGGWQQMLMDFFSRMNPQQGGATVAGGEGQVKPGGNAPQATDPYAKIGYRG